MAFTLTELLIVVATCGMLAALLLPTFRSSVKKAQSAKALSNLRGIGTAVFTYASDHNNFILPVYYKNDPNSHGADRAWTHELVQGGYVDGDKISSQDSSSNWSNSDRWQKLYNPTTRQLKPNAPGSGGFALNVFYNSWEGIGLTQIGRPGQTIMVADSPFGNEWFDWGMGDNDNGVHLFPNTLSGGFAHYLFCDGHTEVIKAQNPSQTDSPPTGYKESVFFVPSQYH